MRFTKMHGLGNDFVLVADGERYLEQASELAHAVCERRHGIGADGLVLLLPSQEGDLAMRIFNADGSEAEQCGNALRCVARYACERLGLHHEQLLIKTRSGLQPAWLTITDGSVSAVRVGMGRPTLAPAAIPVVSAYEQAIDEPLTLEGQIFAVTAVGIGVPHAVIFVEDVEAVPLERWGPQIEHHPLFPRKTNVEFITVQPDGSLAMRVWERGVGVTLACGSGACASLVAAALTGRAGRTALVHMPGGDLRIEWAADDQLFMSGPAAFVFEGEWPIP